jgi:hypothetical protein
MSYAEVVPQEHVVANELDDGDGVLIRFKREAILPVE